MSSHGRLRSDYKGDKMYLDTGTLITVIIALTTSMAVIAMSFAEHRRLLNKYNNLKSDLHWARVDCKQNHVEVPF